MQIMEMVNAESFFCSCKVLSIEWHLAENVICRSCLAPTSTFALVLFL